MSSRGPCRLLGAVDPKLQVTGREGLVPVRPVTFVPLLDTLLSAAA